MSSGQMTDLLKVHRPDLRQINTELAATAHVRECSGFAPAADGLDADRQMVGRLLDGDDTRRNSLL